MTMSFLDKAIQFQSFDFDGYFNSVILEDVMNSIENDDLDLYDLLNLLSGTAQAALEPMAQKAKKLTIQHFGKTIGLYAPIYISDYCTNHCTYCGFNRSNGFERTMLSMQEIEAEARVVADMGIRHVVILTGEAPLMTPLSYLVNAVRILRHYFSSIALEIFPMDENDYRILKDAGADSLTIYQEVYDPNIYREVHPEGRKSNYSYRLLTPERGAGIGFRAINIGPLFGLGKPMIEAFMAGLHASYLEQEFPDVEISLSLPRMRKATSCIEPRHMLSDRDFVQIMLAWRLFMPRIGITISTRESPAFRDRLIHLGATRYSAGSRTNVGGYALKPIDATVQFEVTDKRSVAEISRMIRNNGYEPILKDWEMF